MAASIAKLAILLTTDTSGMQRGFAQAESTVEKFTRHAELAATIGIGALTTAIGSVVREGIRMSAVMETMGASLRVLTGSAAEGGKLLQGLWKFAVQTPFSFEEVARAGKTLLAMGESPSNVMDRLRMLGDVAAGSGQNLTELAQVFGQVQQAGRLTGNELRQFNERGIPLLKTLAEMMGVSKVAIRDMVEEGTLGADKVVEAFRRMTTAGGSFANMSEELQNTLSGQWAKLKDTFSEMSLEIAGGQSGWLKQSMQAINQASENRVNMGRSLAKMLQDMGLMGAPPPLVEPTDRAKVMGAWAAKEERLRAQRAQAMTEEGEKHRNMIDEWMKAENKALEEQDRAMKRRAESLAKSLRTPAEVMSESIQEVSNLFNKGLLNVDMYGRAVAEIKDKFLDAERAGRKLLGGAGLNPGVDYNTAAGAAAVNQAKAEMMRMVTEQKETNQHLKKIEAAFSGVANF